MMNGSRGVGRVFLAAMRRVGAEVCEDEREKKRGTSLFRVGARNHVGNIGRVKAVLTAHNKKLLKKAVRNESGHPTHRDAA